MNQFLMGRKQATPWLWALAVLVLSFPLQAQSFLQHSTAVTKKATTGFSLRVERALTKNASPVWAQTSSRQAKSRQTYFGYHTLAANTALKQLHNSMEAYTPQHIESLLQHINLEDLYAPQNSRKTNTKHAKSLLATALSIDLSAVPQLQARYYLYIVPHLIFQRNLPITAQQRARLVQYYKQIIEQKQVDTLENWEQTMLAIHYYGWLHVEETNLAPQIMKLAANAVGQYRYFTDRVVVYALLNLDATDQLEILAQQRSLQALAFYEQDFWYHIQEQTHAFVSNGLPPLFTPAPTKRATLQDASNRVATVFKNTVLEKQCPVSGQHPDLHVTIQLN